MNKKEAAQTILENLSDDEIKILALEAIERRMKSHDQARSANALLNKLTPPPDKDFIRFFKSFKEAYQYRKENRKG